jgi:hypothetical protein
MVVASGLVMASQYDAAEEKLIDDATALIDGGKVACLGASRGH